MDIRSVEIADLKPAPPTASAAGELDLESVLAATLDPDMPLDKLLGLKPGDSIKIAGGKGVVVRAGGATEPIHLTGVRLGN